MGCIKWFMAKHPTCAPHPVLLDEESIPSIQAYQEKEYGYRAEYTPMKTQQNTQ